MAKKSSRNSVKDDVDEQSVFEQRIQLEKTRDISNEIKDININDNDDYTTVAELILQKIHPLYWKVLITAVLNLKGVQVNAQTLSEAYTNICLNGKFQFQKGHMWTLTRFLPQETKKKKHAKENVS